MKFYFLFSTVFIFNCVLVVTSADFLDWLWFSNERDDLKNGNVDFPTIPFEVQTEDKKFLEEALKFTDLIQSSVLDICQHNVVLKIKTSCFSMTEEELAKLSVNLLNCQSSVDGRKLFPCTDEMTLKSCTESMDPSMWNAYHMMNNRARAVCLAARRTQFQALTEITVNKLMKTSHDQVNHLRSLLQSQENLEKLQFDTIATVRQGNIDLMGQQHQLKNSQLTMQNVVNYNLKELSREKALIAAGHRELSDLTQKIKEKLEKTHSDISNQALETSENYKNLLSDVNTIQKEAKRFFQSIDESTQILIAHNEQAAIKFENTLEKLEKINKTVAYLLSVADKTNEQVRFIQAFLGDSGAQVQSTFFIVIHMTYLLLGMLLAVFLQLPYITRLGLIILVPFNLMIAMDSEKSIHQLSVGELTFSLIFVTVVHALIKTIREYSKPPDAQKHYLTNGTVHLNNEPKSTGNPKKKFGLESISKVFSPLWMKVMQCLSFIHVRNTPENGNRNSTNNFVTPSVQRPVYTSEHDTTDNSIYRWLDSTTQFRGRNVSPSDSGLNLSNSSKIICNAVCRNGRRCRNSSVTGRSYCHVHEAGSSIRG